ncbi:TIGR02206 family membrane protein [Rossellomorea sp. SC111]|uniref:YwaF family protein n=1 Tax=Rossellomorea sp. SC111 TaxID=2968985 RepID=UPI00215A608F|nr:TIGR02206 family membrane protein [Rossellomorea sp. SC111]MCR8850312.1 TIGR02206 family membrane protein [Rossellomorea sp. SC111]
MIREVLNFRQEEYPFELFSASHLAAILVSVGCIVGLYIFRERVQGSVKGLLKWVLIILLVLSEVSFQVWYGLNDQWDVTINLPFQLCSLSLYLCTIMLISSNYRMFEISFFSSMSGAFIAIVTPELFFGFPHFRFFQFFLAHLSIVLSCLYMVWIEGYRLSFGSVIRAFMALNVIAVVAYAVNKVAGANYMFLMHKPYNASPIDYLGEYPWYLLSLEGVSVVLFLILYAPFHLFKKNRKGER